MAFRVADANQKGLTRVKDERENRKKQKQQKIKKEKEGDNYNISYLFQDLYYSKNS